MKKLLVVICGLSLIFSLVACSSEVSGNETSSGITPSSSSSGTASQESAVLNESSAVPNDGTEEMQIHIQTNDKTVGNVATDSTQKPKLNSAPQPILEAPAASVPNSEAETDNSMYQTQIVVGDQSFPTALYKNETTDAIIDRLPMTLTMSDLNANEKYHYFSDSLPTDSIRPSEIHAGDLMLYGTDCLVLFYDSLSSPFSYTPLGYLEDAAGLENALGSGDVQVSFNAK